LLNLGAHVQEGYNSHSVCLSVCLSVCWQWISKVAAWQQSKQAQMKRMMIF